MQTITLEDIEGAERLLGIAYTAAERAQMVNNLDGQRDLVFARITLSQAEFDYRRARYGLLALVDQLAPAEG